jgi:WD40 repeat protein
MCIWRVHDWQCLHVLGGHKASVTDFSIHPSGKLALSISSDLTMRLWNLVQGRYVFIRKRIFALSGFRPFRIIYCIEEKEYCFILCFCYVLIRLHFAIGRCSFTRRLTSPADKILWDETGEHYMIAYSKTVTVRVTHTGDGVDHFSPLQCGLFLSVHHARLFFSTRFTLRVIIL